MAIEKITKFSDAIQPTDIINEVVETINNADLEEFVGASESQAGKKGIVPAPEAGSEDRYLNADGTWKEVKQNLTVYTSLEQIGITPGEETFESISNALPLYSELVYYRGTNTNFNADMYPEGSNYGYVKITKLINGLTKFEYIQYLTTGNEEGSIEPNDQLNIGVVWETYFNSTYPLRPVIWNKVITSKEKAFQELIGPLVFNSTYQELIKLNNVSENSFKDIVAYDTENKRMGLLRFGKYDEGITNGAKLSVVNSEGTALDFVSLYHNLTTGNSFTRLYQNVIIQNGELFFTSATDNNARFGYKSVKSSTDVTNLPQGTYFFYGTAPAEDTDTTLRGTDFQGLSMRQSGQDFQLVITGNNNMFWRADDNSSAESVPKYSDWIRLSSVNNSNHLVFNNGNELWIE